MNPFSALILLQGRRAAFVPRLVAALLRRFGVKASPALALVAASVFVGGALIRTAWKRNRADEGAPLWPLVLPPLAIAGVMLAGLAAAPAPTVDLSLTEPGELALAQASEAAPPPDRLGGLRYDLASDDPQRVTIGFMAAGGRAPESQPLLETMQQILTREDTSAGQRVPAFIKVVPEAEQSAALLQLGLVGGPGVKVEAWCLLGERGHEAGAEAMGAFMDAAGQGDSADARLLQRAVACVPKFTGAGTVRMIPHLRGLLERMSQPPHTDDEATGPLASLGVWRETFTALWALAPDPSTKSFAADLAEKAPPRARNDRLIVVSQVAR